MADKTFTRADFTIPRTPAELAAYVRETCESIASIPELRQIARLRREPYKTFLEELMPFSHFCTWRYGKRDDVLCSLVHGTPCRDAIVTSRKTGIEHSVEITWPIDGQYMIDQARQINEKGHTTFKTWKCNDTTRQQSAANRILEIARKKSLRDYRNKGGSTIIFVMDLSYFWDSDPAHMKILEVLRSKLASMPILADNCVLMQIEGDEKMFFELKRGQNF